MAKKKRLPLHWKIMIGLGLGVTVGLLINGLWPDEGWAAFGVGDFRAFAAGEASDANKPTFLARAMLFVRNLNTLVGGVFMNGLKFIAVPIVLFSLITGASSLNDMRKLSRIGGKTIVIYLCTTAVAITIGLVLANVVRPGRMVGEETLAGFRAMMEASPDAAPIAPPSMWEFLQGLIPTNPFQAMAAGNTLQVVVLALAVGVALTLVTRSKAAPVIAFFDGMTDVIIKLVDIIMLIAPYAVFALMAQVVADQGRGVLVGLAGYSATVIGGLAVMAFVVYPFVLRVVGRVSYRRFLSGAAPAQLVAFSTSSSSATLPVTIECAKERIGVSEEVASFVLPIGATINMDGTALYQGVATVFIAQLFGMDLTITQQLTVILTATLASIGTAGVPGAGIVMLTIVLQSVGVPTAGIAVILGVDRILDMCRTTINITGDLMVASVVAATENELLSAEEVRRRYGDAALADVPDTPPPGHSDSGGRGPARGA